jgi:orotidine-5'-phosphate decarboxylase
MLFSDRLAHSIHIKNSCLMLGLDPNPEKFPTGITKDAKGALEFCTMILEKTHDIICGIKIQMAYWEAFGSEGIRAVEILLAAAKSLELITMVDGKRNDIGSTAEAYGRAYLDNGPLGADCLTVNPLLGSDGITPFIKKCEDNDRGIFVLLRTSNPSAEEFQGGKAEISLRIAEKIDEWNVTTQSPNNFYSAVGAVIGATVDPKLLQFFRDELPNTWFLCPGVGAQGASLEEVLAVRDERGLGLVIPVSRSVLYAGNGEDYALKAREVMLQLWEDQKL